MRESAGEPETPLCLHCLSEVSPFGHYCHVCGHSVGQFTPFLPLEGTRFFGEFMGEIWRRLWFGEDRSLLHRLMCVVVLAATVPWIFLASPLAIWRLAKRGAEG